jgi:hypothetical protein
MTRTQARKIVLELSPLPHTDKFMWAVNGCPDAVLIVQAKYLLSRSSTDRIRVS